MRKSLAHALRHHEGRDNCFFLTGDLGFMALEELRTEWGSRFINAGVAEQNMIGVAAGLAREGFSVYVYSIASFCYARPFEQIRNDLCFPGLPVCLIGNGGGYAYGSMGPTHHALEDCGALNALGMRVVVPAFDEDIPDLIQNIDRPTYLRLGYDSRPPGTTVESYAAWRQVLSGRRGAMAALGPLAGVAWSALKDLSEAERPSVWAVSEFGTDEVPEEFWSQVQHRSLYVAEEHVAAGGLGMHLSLAMAQCGVQVQDFIHRFALRYPTKTFGSQEFHRAQSGLDETGLRSMIVQTLQFDRDPLPSIRRAA